MITNFETWAQSVCCSTDPSRAGGLQSLHCCHGDTVINYSEKSQLACWVVCGVSKMLAHMPTGDLCFHSMGAGFAGQWNVSPINAPPTKRK